MKKKQTFLSGWADYYVDLIKFELFIFIYLIYLIFALYKILFSFE